MRLAARGDIVRVDVDKARLTVADLGGNTSTVGTAIRADGIALPGLEEERLIALVATALVGRHTIAMPARVLANGHTFLQLHVPLVAHLALALAVLQATAIGAVTLASELTHRPGSIYKPVTHITLTLIWSHTSTVFAGLAAFRFADTAIPTIRIALSAQTHIRREALPIGSTALTLRNALTAPGKQF